MTKAVITNRDASVSRDTLRNTLRTRFGLQEFRPGQEDIIEAALSGRDVIAIMPTGSGKSLLYQLPALILDGLTVIVSPLIALMKDQTDKLGVIGVDALTINSGLTTREQNNAARSLASGGGSMLYVTPERFRDREFFEMLLDRKVALFVVDEAHCVSHWGHDFRHREEDRAIQGYFLGGKYPDDGEALNVARVVNRLEAGESASLNDIADKSGVARRKARIVLTLMKRFGAMREYRGGGWERVIGDVTTVPLHDQLLDYESRRQADRAKLESMIRYCRTAQCRTRQIMEYFGEQPERGHRCGHCDNDVAVDRLVS